MTSRTIRATWLGLLAAVAFSGAARAEIIYGITTTALGGSAGINLVSFDSSTPGTFITNVPMTGITAGEAVRAIDFRPATGELYAISGSTTVGATGTMYTVNLATGALTVVGTAGNTGLLPANTSGAVSIDFNPVADRMRVVTGNDRNFRLNPNDGTVTGADTALAYAAGDPHVGGNIIAIGAAYSNNVAGATSTTLYAWDYNLDNLVTIGNVGGTPNSPNTGLAFTIGADPADFITNGANFGFDISGGTGIGYVNFNADADSLDHLATIDLATGNLTNLGTFTGFMLDISVQPTAVPEPGSMILCGVGLAGFAARRLRKKK